jgi:hypothetical protein
MDMSQLNHDTPLLTYIRQPDGIYVVTLRVSGQDTCDELLTVHEAALRAHDPTKPFQVLFDIRQSGVLHLTYLFRQVASLYRTIVPMPPIYAAYVYTDNAMVSVAKSFMELLRVKGRRDFFQGDEAAKAEALRWLADQEG